MFLEISLIPGLPLAASVIITLFTSKLKKVSATLATVSILGSFLLSVRLFIQQIQGHIDKTVETSLTWLQVGGLHLEWGYLLNPLTLTMLLVVTGVGSLIFLFSWSYMYHDKAWSRYFGSLSFFTFAMLGIVTANNLLQVFIFWELVGFASYLLISFWFEKDSAALAGKKAFIVNRLGDVFFLCGIILIWFFSNPVIGERTLNFVTLASTLPSLGLPSDTLFLLCLLVFMGVVGKSAQFPLHVWLPDAMEGPTPVSALIHAATMVAAGVFLLSRTFFLFELSSTALLVVGSIGLITCVISALVAIGQDDIKRILAYSTLSQLGYMVLAVGSGDPAAGMFHLMTHAFFKALLFLGAGSVIHALSSQEIWKMGGIKSKMPITTFAFGVGALALGGVFPFAGFFSKDAILLAAHNSNPIFYWGGLLVVFLTAFYVGRLFVVAFMGKPGYAVTKCHESSWVMILPLIILTLLSIGGGFIPVETYLTGHTPEPLSRIIGLSSTALAILGFGSAYFIYRSVTTETNPQKRKDPLVISLGPVRRLLEKRLYIDDLYDGLVIIFQNRWSLLLATVDKYIILGIEEDLPSKFTKTLSKGIRLLQSGKLSFYTLLFVISVAILSLISISGMLGGAK
jgi:NADH-quinone oxidoreductase subunit L